MRRRVLLPIAAAALAGCGASEEAARDAFRRGSIEACLTSSRQAAPPALAGFDWERLCACATDRIMAGKSARELTGLRPGGPGQHEAVAACLAQIRRGGGSSAP